MPIVTDERRCGKRRYIGWLVLFATLAVGVAAAFAFQVDAQEARALRTPGAVVAVTRGNEPLVLGTAWQKWLLPRFPHLAEYVGGTIWLPQGGKAGQMVVWSNSGPRTSYAIFGEQEILLTDEQEKTTTVSAALNSSPYIVRGSANTRVQYNVEPIATIDVKLFPRQGAQLRLRLPTGGQGEARPLGFVLANPAFRP
jgi:hypothetical protein